MKTCKIIKFLSLAAIAFLLACSDRTQPVIKLSGQWRFAIDSTDIGEQQIWYSNRLADTVSLPGSMASNGKGNDIDLSTKWVGDIRKPLWYEDPNYAPYVKPDDIQFPFWLQPKKKYTGAAWYQKEVNIPKGWEKKVIFLNLERCHWESGVWVGDQKVGSQNSLSTAHRYNLTPFLSPGKHSISIRIDNRVGKIDPGVNSHSVSDHTQTNWNGIIGDIFLEARDRVYFSDIQSYPNAAEKTVTIKGVVTNTTDNSLPVEILAKATGKNFKVDLPIQSLELTAAAGENTFEMKYSLGNEVFLWDEFNPNLYNISLQLTGDEINDEQSEVFGIRQIKSVGRQLAINNRPAYLRGTLECAIFPKTGYPATDVESWKGIYETIQAYGLNHLRFHSWCPPKAAFEAADEMGVYLQVECGSWANQSTTLGDGHPIDKFVWDESKRIVKAYGNHPSFIMMAYGNEPGGDNFSQYLADFVDKWKSEDPRRIYTSAAGWPAIPENDFHNVPQPRIQAWGEGLKSIINAQPPTTDYDWSDRMPADTIPVISHEIGQWCVYPNFKETAKYTGVLEARNFELFEESLKAKHLGDLAGDFLMASGKLQTLCYKADIEAALRTPNQAGFQLLDLHDFPGQGTALVGVLDPFWEDKGYVTSEEYSRFCNTTVPLARIDKRTFMEGGTLVADIQIAHFGPSPIQQATPTWTLRDTSGQTIGSGNLPQKDIPLGNSTTLGKITHQFEEIGQPRKLVLEVAVNGFKNSWDLWAYPKTPSKTSSQAFKHVTSLDAETASYLQNGGKVLLSLGKGKVSADKGGDIGVGFSSIFWNTAWTDNQKPHTLGILCDPLHPALQQFPTEYHSNWQWWDAMAHADVVVLDDFSNIIKPIVRVIDDWVTNRSLGLIFEAKVGNGKLVICGADLKNQMGERPEARQLLHSLAQYMESSDFHPEVELSMDEVKSIMKKNAM